MSNLFLFPILRECPSTIFLILLQIRGLASPLTCVKVAEHSLWAVSGNSRDGETWWRKTNGIRKTTYVYRVLNNENFKTEVEQKNFVTHLIITVRL